MAQHLACQRVTKLVGTHRWGRDTSAPERTSNDRSNGNLTHKSADGSSAAEKHASVRALRASVTDVRCNCLADIRWKWKCALLTAFPADGDLSGIPVDIV